MGTIKNPKGIWGILTGDIINSSLLSQSERSRLLDFLSKEIGVLPELIPPGAKVYGPQIFRGDSWQMAVFPAKNSLDIGIRLRAALKRDFYGVDTRVAIGIGQVMLLIKEYVSTGLGPAFTLSGNTLDQMADSRILLRTEKDISAQTRTGKSLELIVRYIDEVITDWTPAQARAVLSASMGKDQLNIARDWEPTPITQQAVSAHLIAADWKLLRESINFVEDLIEDWDHLEEA